MASPYYSRYLETPDLQIGESSISPTDLVRNLGVMFDKFINMNDHVTSVCRAAYYHLKNIRSLKPFLSQDALITVVHAFVTSRIDYCNSLLYGIAGYNINRLQRIQNGAARLVRNNGKYSHVKIIPQKLHWLPVKQRIHFKILITTYRCIYSEAPKYLCDLILIIKNQADLSGHPVRHYCRCRFLGAIGMVTVHLVLQVSVCGTGCRKMLKGQRL